MKLDDAGAAFFVEGVADEEEHASMPPELATSPLPNTYFPPHWESREDGKASKSANRSLMEAFNKEDVDHDTSSRVLIDEPQLEMGQEALEDAATCQPEPSNATKEDTNISIQTDSTNNVKKKLNYKKRKRRSMNKKHTRSNSKSSMKDITLESEDVDVFETGEINEPKQSGAHSSDDIFDMDDVNDDNVIEMSSTPTATHHDVLDIKMEDLTTMKPAIELTSTSVPTTPVTANCPSIKNDNSSSFLSSRLPDQDQLDSMLAKQEQDASDESDGGNRNIPSSRNAHVDYFSEPENITSPMGSRPGSPIMSDSELMSESSGLRKKRENEGKERGEQKWEWGQLPSTTTTPAQEKVVKICDEPDSSTKTEEIETETIEEDSGWKFLWFRSRSESSNKRTKKEDNIKNDEGKDDQTQTGVTLESLQTEEEIQKYIGSHFHSNSKSTPITTGRVNSYSQLDSDNESGNGPSLPMSPHSVEGTNQYYQNEFNAQPYRLLKDIDISFCGAPKEGEEFSPKLFELQKVPFDDFTMLFKIGNNPFENQNLVVRIGDQYYDWKAACPIILSVILYGRTFPNEISTDTGKCIWSSQKKQTSFQVGDASAQTAESGENQQDKASSWWPFGSKAGAEDSLKPEIQGDGSSNDDIAEAVATAFGATEVIKNEVQPASDSKMENEQEGLLQEDDEEVLQEVLPVMTNDDQVDNVSHPQASEHAIIELESETNLTCESIKTDNSTSIDIELENNTPTNQDISIDIEKASMYVQEGESLPKTPTRISRSEANISSSSETSQIDDILKSENIFGKFKKTLRLSSDLIKALNLRPGSNEVQFSVTTAYQGTTKCRCHLYLWKSTDKIVISDIDGTITKSDVLGHILPIIGKDWAQSGVASLFTKIVNNGYHIAYLSARSIGHAAVTKDYLKSVNQGDMILPDGPLLLNPTSLVSALHREVIIKKPEEFKIACLRDIQKLFPENPFYCGYGNRTNVSIVLNPTGCNYLNHVMISSIGNSKFLNMILGCFCIPSGRHSYIQDIYHQFKRRIAARTDSNISDIVSTQCNIY